MSLQIPQGEKVYIDTGIFVQHPSKDLKSEDYQERGGEAGDVEIMCARYAKGGRVPGPSDLRALS